MVAKRGIIFDFNGTMYMDSDKQEEAWIQFLMKQIGRELTEDEILNRIHGRVNADILKYFISPDLSEDEIERLSGEKEAAYRQLCLLDKAGMNFTEGLEVFLDDMKRLGIPMTIATASPKVNVDFFIEKFRLERWFDIDKILYNDGSFPGKPAPDIYVRAAQIIQMAPKDCLVIEDAISGVIAANRAGIGKIIGIPAAENKTRFEAMNEVNANIVNFKEFDYQWLEI